MIHNEELKPAAENGITTKFTKKIWSSFTRALREYELIKSGDKIAVCISGGKDSMLMSVLFKELSKYNNQGAEFEYIVMNPGYSKDNIDNIRENIKKLDIPAKIFNTDIFASLPEKSHKAPCYSCAGMRREYLYEYAAGLGCNKIALGHHFDDVIETILMGMLYGGQIQTMLPKLYSSRHKGMELIRPLYFIREDHIRAWAGYNGLKFISCDCGLAAHAGMNPSKRKEIKELIVTLKKNNPNVEQNIFKSVGNISLNSVIAYKDANGRHHFLDNYDEESYTGVVE